MRTVRYEDATEYGLTQEQARVFDQGDTDDLFDLAEELGIDTTGIEPWAKYVRRAIREALATRP